MLAPLQRSPGAALPEKFRAAREFLRMSPLSFASATFAVSVVAGTLGSLLGLGGGVIVVPALLALGVDMHVAVGAAAVSVIATSSGAASRYLRQGFTNLRVAMFLEVGTVAGALTGALLSGVVDERALSLVFGCVLTVSAIALLRRSSSPAASASAAAPPSPSLAASGGWLALEGTFVDETGATVSYRARRPPLALALMYVAGIISGLLGIGSGALKVLAMDLAMGLPLKVSSATSNLMIGVTAASTAGVFFMRGDISPFVVAPVAAGVVVGAQIGARLMRWIPPRLLRGLFVLVVVVIAVQMFSRGLR